MTSKIPARAHVRAALHLVVVLLTAAVALAVFLAVAQLTGCPRLPEPDGCTPRDTACRGGVPHVCSPTQRWTPADRACAELGATCCATRSAYGGRVLHACVPAARCEPETAPTPDGGSDR
jgi:hypothetical protein